MENPEDEGVFLHSLKVVTSMKLSREESMEPEQAGQSEPGQEQIDNRELLAKWASIEFRMQQLQSRRFLLLKMKRCRKKDERHSRGSTEELIIEEDHEDNDDDELRTIQVELEDLQMKKEELERVGVSLTANSNEVPKEQLPTYKETPRGGIYMLPPPPPPPPQEVTAAAPEPAENILPVEKLGMAAGITKCPSCDEVVVTETRSTTSETMWIMCCACSLMGCVAGCCLIPFYMKRLRNVSHHCPRCQAKIHTYKLL